MRGIEKIASFSIPRPPNVNRKVTPELQPESPNLLFYRAAWYDERIFITRTRTV